MPKFINSKIVPVLIAGLFLLGILLIGKGQPPINEGLRISFLNVGQGDATLISTGTNQILIDGGPDKSVLSELGENMPPNDKKIETIILTHPHADHAAGLNYVLDRFEVDLIYLSGQKYSSPDYSLLLEKINTLKIPTRQLLAPDVLYFGEAQLRVLWPAEGTPIKEDPNNGSIVLQVNYKDINWLLLGDLPNEKQDEMIAKYDLKEADLLKVAHHGSVNGVSENLFRLVNPKYSVISVGKNYYGHPAPSLISRINSSQIFRTDQNGSIKFLTDGKTTSIFE